MNAADIQNRNIFVINLISNLFLSQISDPHETKLQEISRKFCLTNNWEQFLNSIKWEPNALLPLW